MVLRDFFGGKYVGNVFFWMEVGIFTNAKNPPTIYEK
jgi:hypothetical protein